MFLCVVVIIPEIFRSPPTPKPHTYVHMGWEGEGEGGAQRDIITGS